MMREIVLDTETTGISPLDGHRIIEIGALELMHHLPTGKQLHIYINPERDIDQGAVAVHGLTSEFLSDKPVFASIVDEFLEFIGDAPLVIHNASFDMGFINAELEKIQRPVLPMDRAIDTLTMARRKFLARHGQCISGTVHWQNRPLNFFQLGIDKPHIKAGIMDDQRRIADKF